MMQVIQVCGLAQCYVATWHVTCPIAKLRCQSTYLQSSSRDTIPFFAHITSCQRQSHFSSRNINTHIPCSLQSCNMPPTSFLAGWESLNAPNVTAGAQSFLPDPMWVYGLSHMSGFRDWISQPRMPTSGASQRERSLG